MGHREQLLAAARQCLIERGYAGTTARDLVAASDTNLGSIGYHFGSKEALLVEALNEAFTEYTEKVRAAAYGSSTDSADPRQVVETAWLTMISIMSEYRPLLVALVEALAQAERNESLRNRLAKGYE
ncbi:MAG: TetR/AcrR family transcriptional regulator, partial [Acidimicrobiales bacterium]